MWLIAMVALVLTAGEATLLPYGAVHADTGEPVENWGAYLEAPNRCVATDSSLEPGVSAEQPGCVWVVYWLPVDATGATELPTAPESLPPSGCEAWWPFTVD